MKRVSIGNSAPVATAALSFCLVANLVALMTFPAVLPEVSAEWQLSASEAGWIGGIYFAGYAAAVLFLVGMTDRFDGRWIVIASSLLGAGASFAFVGLADGFWPALVIRFLGGVALAGVHMPGLVLLIERAEGPHQSRSVSIYTASYALGSAGSFLVAGIVDAMFGWRATFLAGGIGPLLAIATIACLSPAPARKAPAGPVLEFGSVLRNRPFMSYVLAFAGNTWEVFGIRVWFVACLSWTLQVPGNELDLPNLAIISGLASLAGVPASIAVAELATKWNRSRVIVMTCVVSVAVCLALAASAGGPIVIVLTLLVLLQITSFADVSALGVGAVLLSDPARRGAALAVYALTGFTTGFLGPAAVGLSLDWFGGIDSRLGWTAAFLTMSIGSAAAGLAVWKARHAEQLQRHRR
ncbi:MAG: MFS transporter [Reyranella sp.]|nr:MFS transporter [Reyranella sp.]MDP3158573.1 MFS transporter [Reyranella sp.]